jgi:hypothetical protein
MWEVQLRVLELAANVLFADNFFETFSELFQNSCEQCGASKHSFMLSATDFRNFTRMYSHDTPVVTGYVMCL